MPRGVPASGKRQPRAVSAFSEAAETPVAGGAVDVEGRVEAAFDDEVAPADFPAEELSGEVQVDLAPQDQMNLADPPLVDPPLEARVPAPAGVVELSPEQREIQYLKDQLAKVLGKKDVDLPVEELSRPGDTGNILIHFLEDGLSALGKVWYRGEELEFEVGSQAYKDTFNRRGETWLDLRNDEFAQVDRWGKIMFRNGRWPGKTYADGTFEALRLEKGDGSVKPPSAEELAAAEKARQRRAAPRLPSLTQ